MFRAFRPVAFFLALSASTCIFAQSPDSSQTAALRRIEQQMVAVKGNPKKELAGFSIAKYEITQQDWQAIMGSAAPSRPAEAGCALCPVGVTWHDAQAFVAKLRSLSGKNYSLPSAAQWEWAAAAGKKSKYAGAKNAKELGSYAWFYDNSQGRTHPVGNKKPNAWGLYDMNGNVEEWTLDAVNALPENRAVRGGHFAENAHNCAINIKDSYSVGKLNETTPQVIGIRLVLLP